MSKDVCPVRRRLWGGNALRLSYVLCQTQSYHNRKPAFSLGVLPTKVAITATSLIIVDKIQQSAILELT